MPAREINQQIKKSIDWLIQIRNEDKGWPSEQGMESSVLNTAEVILTLIRTKFNHNQRGQQIIDEALCFLISKQDDSGAWCRKNFPDLVRTTYSCRALIASKTRKEKVILAIKQSLKWILSRKNSDNGWSYNNRIDESSIMATCFSLRALIPAYVEHFLVRDEVIREGIRFLETKIEHITVEGAGHHAIHALLVVQEAHKAGIAGFDHLEKSILNWLEKQKDAILKLGEDIVYLINDEDEAPYQSYSYKILSDALIIEVIVNANNKNKEIIRNALLNIDKRIDERGGVYGDKCFSWSTAKAINALYAANKLDEFSKIPTRKLAIDTIANRIIAFFSALILFIAPLLISVFLGESSAVVLDASVLVPYYAISILFVLIIFGYIEEKDYIKYIPFLNKINKSS